MYIYVSIICKVLYDVSHIASRLIHGCFLFQLYAFIACPSFCDFTSLAAAVALAVDIHRFARPSSFSSFQKKWRFSLMVLFIFGVLFPLAHLLPFPPISPHLLRAYHKKTLKNHNQSPPFFRSAPSSDCPYNKPQEP